MHGNGRDVAACGQWTIGVVYLLIGCFLNSIFLVGHLDASLADKVFAWRKYMYRIVYSWGLGAHCCLYTFLSGGLKKNLK